jgi:NADH-quinone oxidoreductase subunit N
MLKKILKIFNTKEQFALNVGTKKIIIQRNYTKRSVGGTPSPKLNRNFMYKKLIQLRNDFVVLYNSVHLRLLLSWKFFVYKYLTFKNPESNRSSQTNYSELKNFITSYKKEYIIRPGYQAHNSLYRRKFLELMLKLQLVSLNSFIWVFNNLKYFLRLFFLFMIWCCLYSLQYAGDSLFLNFLCSYNNIIFYKIIEFIYYGIFQSYYIWFIPFLWIFIWLVSLFIQCLSDTILTQKWLKTNIRNASELAFINLAQFQLLEFGLFLFGFIILLLNIKNSTLNLDYFDQTSTQIFYFNSSKIYIIILIIILLYGCFLFTVLSIQKQKFYISKLPNIFIIFIILFLTMLILLHTSSLILIIMCLETLALATLYFMIFNFENISTKFIIKSIVQFFLAQAIASLLYIYGMSWLSIGYPTLTSLSQNFYEIYPLIKLEEQVWCISGFTYLLLGLIMKIGIGPLGLWIFSVIRQINYITIVIYFIFIKIVYFFTLINIIQQYLGFQWENGSFFLSNWKFIYIFIGFGISSLVIGLIILLSTQSIKSFIAASSFLNFGFILPTFYFGGSLINLSFIMVVPYIFVYSFTTLIFIWLVALKSNINSDNITDLKGFFQSNKLIGFLFIIVLSSLAGLPPFGGFFTKYYVLRELYNIAPNITQYLIVLSIFAALGYARILIQIFLEPIKQNENLIIENVFIKKIVTIQINLFFCFSFLIIIGYGIIFYIYNNEILYICSNFSTIYIENIILPQREYFYIFNDLKILDSSFINKLINEEYFNIIENANKKLNFYLKSFN